jgi:hypothetical protein
MGSAPALTSRSPLTGGLGMLVIKGFDVISLEKLHFGPEVKEMQLYGNRIIQQMNTARTNRIF